MINLPEKAPPKGSPSESQPSGWESVATMANQYITQGTLLKAVSDFERETWHYGDMDDSTFRAFDSDMRCVDALKDDIKSGENSAESLKHLSDRLNASIGTIKFRYGFESEIIGSNSALAGLKRKISDIHLDHDDSVRQYAKIEAEYRDFVSQNRDMSFIGNSYEKIHGKEGLYLAVESLKSLISNDNYRQLLSSNQVEEVFTDCVKINRGIGVGKIESKYRDVIKKIWAQSLTNNIDEGGKFRVLFSSINSPALKEQAESLLKRPMQASCSLISSNFIATFGSSFNRIGFVYPNDSEILLASAYDLSSNVFDSSVVNREKGTKLATPEVIEKIGIARTKEKGEDLFFSNQYSEILVSSKPCGILVIGLGEGDINIYYNQAEHLSLEKGLPMQSLDVMRYQDHLSEADKYYIAFHSMASYLGYSPTDFYSTYARDNHRFDALYRSIETYKDRIADVFLSMKKSGILSKKNMCEALGQIVTNRK